MDWIAWTRAGLPSTFFTGGQDAEQDVWIRLPPWVNQRLIIYAFNSLVPRELYEVPNAMRRTTGGTGHSLCS